MDKRDFLLNLLKNYHADDQAEEQARKQMLEFVQTNPDCFDNDFAPGHITGSALVVDKDIKHTLLTHHATLNKWFQFGGHADGHWNPLEVGWREAEEESGLTSLMYFPKHEGIFDLEVQLIPERGHMPTHKHYDVRILLVANKDEPYKVSAESHDLRWVHIEDAAKFNSQPAFLRMLGKVARMAY